MANADTPEDALTARNNGAQGIGLCRTEHMVTIAPIKISFCCYKCFAECVMFYGLLQVLSML